MRKPTWQQIQTGLRAGYEPPPVRDANEFWADFRARAALMNQEQESTVASRPMQWHRPAWALATAAALVVLFVLSPTLRNGKPVQNGVVLADHSEVQEIEVFVPYSSMMIMQDAESGTSVVWLTDVETPKTPVGEG